MKLTVGKSRSILFALRQLDGFKRVVHSAGRDEIVTLPYKFRPSVRMAIAMNIAALEPVDEAFGKTSRDIMLGYSADGRTIPTEKQADIGTEVEELLSAENDVTLRTLSEEDLGLTENQIPPSVISSLLPLIIATS